MARMLKNVMGGSTRMGSTFCSMVDKSIVFWGKATFPISYILVSYILNMKQSAEVMTWKPSCGSSCLKECWTGADSPYTLRHTQEPTSLEVIEG